MPDEPAHPEPDHLILDYRGPDKGRPVFEKGGRPPLDNLPAIYAGGFAISTAASFMLLLVLLFTENRTMIPCVLLLWLVLSAPAALLCGIVGVYHARRPNTRGLFPSVCGIAAGLVVIVLFGILLVYGADK
ncbi:MAG: hypothetical protein ACHRHE_01530 [Tepidisphaerales bacterium]